MLATPLAWVTWKTRDLRVAIYADCLLNLPVHSPPLDWQRS